MKVKVESECRNTLGYLHFDIAGSEKIILTRNPEAMRL